VAVELAAWVTAFAAGAWLAWQIETGGIFAG
jgi:hypothetical protein